MPMPRRVRPKNLRDALALTPSEPDRGGRKKQRPPVRLLALSLVFGTYCKAAAADRAQSDGRVRHAEQRGASALPERSPSVLSGI